MSLSREEILEADDTVTEPVLVPEWGDSVIVRGMTGKELDDYQNSNRRFINGEMIPQLDNVRTKLVVRCLIGDDGERLFKDQDVNALSKKSGAVIDRLYDVAARLSGISEEMQAELEGNSGAAQSGNSSSSSPETSTTAP